MKSDPPFAGSYWPTVAVALLALCPDLVLSTALGLVRPTVASDLGAASVSWSAPISNAALALGAVISADLVQRFTNRSLFLSYQVVFIAGSLMGAFAPDVPVFVAGHVIQGFSTGLLLIAALPPLLTRFGVGRLRSTITFAVIGLFGATTAGPLIGGFVAQAGLWRWMFAATAAIGLANLILASLVLPRYPPVNPGLRFDASALALAACGSGLTFFGVGALMFQKVGSPLVYVPVAVGLISLASLIVLESVRREPLMPVRVLTSTFPVMGILAAIISGAVFTGLLQLVILYLQMVRSLDPLATGLLLWPNLAAGLVGALIVGVVLPSRWVLTMPLFGMLCLALAAWRLTGLTADTPTGTLLWVAGALGLGASLTVTPGLLMAALSATPALVGRAIALVQLLRLTSAYAVAPVLLYFAQAGGASLIDGLHVTFRVALGITLAGIVVITLVYLAGGAKLHPPRLRSFLEEEEPAFESPPIRSPWRRDRKDA